MKLAFLDRHGFRAALIFSAAMSTHSEMLAGVPLFAQLSQSERRLLAERIDVITVEAASSARPQAPMCAAAGS